MDIIFPPLFRTKHIIFYINPTKNEIQIITLHSIFGFFLHVKNPQRPLIIRIV